MLKYTGADFQKPMMLFKNYTILLLYLPILQFHNHIINKSKKIIYGNSHIITSKLIIFIKIELHSNA